MVYWIVSYEKDADGKRINYRARNTSSRPGRPRGDYLSIKGPDFRHANVVDNEKGELTIVENTTLKSQEDQKKIDRKDELEKFILFLDSFQPNDITTLAKARVVLNRLVRAVKWLVKDQIG